VEPRPPPRELGVVLLALAIAALARAETFAALVLSYFVAWVVLNYAAVRGIEPPKMSRRATVGLALAIGIVPLSALAARWRALAENEALLGIEVHVADRLRLERSPQIHPPLVAGDRPQTFWVYADGAEHVRATLAPGIEAIDGEALGHGLFRVEYDPRAHGTPRASGEAEAEIDVEGSIARRALGVIVPHAHPRWLRASSDRTRACTTSEETDELAVVGPSGEILRRAVGDGPTDCAWLEDAVAVTHRYGDELLVIALDGSVRARVPVGSGQLRLAIQGGLAAVAFESGAIAIVDLALAREVARTDRVGGPVDWIAWTADGAVVVARREPAALLRLVVLPPRLAIERRRELLAPAVTMTAAGSEVLVATTDWSDDPAPHLGNHFVQDQIVALDATTLEPLRHVATARRSPRQDVAGGLDRGISPMGIDVEPDGRWRVAFAGSDEIATLEVAGVEPSSLDVARHALSAPHSAVVLADGSIAATSPSSGRIAILEADGSLRAAIDLAPTDTELLRDDPEALRRRFGERAFYEATRAGISCQSCHLHGASDGLLHNIGSRQLSPTLDVHGIARTAPYLRDGSYPRIGDLHEVADELYRGWREPAGDRASTLEAWIASLPRAARPWQPRDPDRERAGLDVFARAGCPTCHAPPAMTNLSRHPVRAVFPDAEADPGASLDTPSLLGASRRSRWLFDGRARTLPSIFLDHNSHQRHGRTRRLSERELEDLVRFLESL
jgi:hypothetical protein